ncbi:solute carrier family 2, facilitated glucose transporter member 1-like [Watersipora subatra]|uniref:solute carrier family 2, facilitated glucose transporter member 1-like n=1 Tax=Watersipora subatra TaxID=2589382 RepID=UPI00355B60DC
MADGEHKETSLLLSQGFEAGFKSTDDGQEEGHRDTSTRPYDIPVANGWLYFCVTACVIGTSFSFGYALGCLNTPAQVIEEQYLLWHLESTGQQLSESSLTFLWSCTVSIYCLGGILSGCVGGTIADKLGRKRCMMLMNIVQVLAVALMFSSMWLHSYGVIIAGRFIYGLYGGLATIVCPLYLNEISPQSLRGITGSIHQLTVVIALLFSQVIGIPSILGTSNAFYYILALPIIPAVLHWAMLAVCPESPTWLYLKAKDREGARAALEKLRNMSVMTSVDGELEDYHRLELSAASEPQVSFTDMFRTYRWRPLAVATVMHASQQLCGVNAVLFYSTIIFVDAGLSEQSAQYSTISLGAINIVMTLVSLALVERLGRRTLHLYGLCGSFISLGFLTVFFVLQDTYHMVWMSNFCIVFVSAFMICFFVGPANIPWMYTPELFDMSSRKWAISIATAINWACNFSVGVSFPSIQISLDEFAFLPFMFIIALCWTFLYYRAPETKDRSSLDITNYFKTIDQVASTPNDASSKDYSTFSATQ